MQKRLFILIIAVVLAAALTTGLVSIRVISDYNDQNHRSYLLAAARLVQMEARRGLKTEEACAAALEVHNNDGNKIRITIVNRKGIVLYDSEADPATMDNHLFRPEISYALQNKTVGSAVRLSDTLQQEMLYIALYNPDTDQVIRTAMSLQAYRASLNRILLTILLVMAATLLLLILFGWILSRKITRPLLRLEQAAKAMSAGQFNTRVLDLQERGGSEITAVSTAFNAMAQELETVIRNLEGTNAKMNVIFDSMTDPLLVVSKDTTVLYLNNPAREIFGRDLKPSEAKYPLYLITHSDKTDELVRQAIDKGKPAAMECQLFTTRGEITFNIIASPIQSVQSEGVILTFHDISEAKKLQKMRSDFVANVTHELRTPLTSIRGFIETLRSGAKNNPEVADRFLEIIDIEADRLHKLISDILILSEIEDLREEKDRENFDLYALIDDVAVLLDDAADAKKVGIIVEGETQLQVSANRYRIKQVLINLVDNAIKYNQEGGKVFMSAERQPDGLVKLVVRDTGKGILPEHQERVFERFYRVDDSRSRELGGTGLGLSIVKHIAQLYDGTAQVESAPGQGSTFTVTLAI